MSAAPVQPITSLNIDGTASNVTDLSPAVQALVSVYNSWNQDVADAQNAVAQKQAALNDLSRQIILQVKSDADAAAAAVQAAADAAAAAAAVAPAANDSTVVADVPAAVPTVQ